MRFTSSAAAMRFLAITVALAFCCKASSSALIAFCKVSTSSLAIFMARKLISSFSLAAVANAAS